MPPNRRPRVPYEEQRVLAKSPVARGRAKTRLTNFQIDRQEPGASFQAILLDPN